MRYSEDFSSTKWEEHYLSKVFWDSENPAKEWLDIWNASDLLEKRRRRSFYSYTKEDRLGDGEFTHSYVGIALLDYLFSKDEPDIEQACLLFESILVNVLNEPGLLSFDGLPLFLSNIFARLPHIFKVQQTNENELLKGYFSWLGGDHQLISLCAYGMHKNGYDITQIENLGSIFSGKSLKQIIATYIEWEEREGGKPNRYDWPSNCRSMFNDAFQNTA
ncbi:hypothetical protein [Terasakiella pusilla]|uniref:hypothetical protein n=1 Tax=Terasakiella pusilla TaxID=64973 RepID=UPI003AA93B3F